MAKEKEIRIVDYETDYVLCNLCGRKMSIPMYDKHYEKCLDIDFLTRRLREEGKEVTREQIENTTAKVFDNLMRKYYPGYYDRES